MEIRKKAKTLGKKGTHDYWPFNCAADPDPQIGTSLVSALL